MWEKQSATVVMLTQEREKGKVKCHRYWPSTGATSYGSLQVILHAVTEYPDYTLRELKIVDLKVSCALVMGISIREISIFIDTSGIVSYSILEFYQQYCCVSKNIAMSVKILQCQQKIA